MLDSAELQIEIIRTEQKLHRLKRELWAELAFEDFCAKVDRTPEDEWGMTGAAAAFNPLGGASWDEIARHHGLDQYRNDPYGG